MTETRTLTAFRGELRFAAGSAGAVALRIKRAMDVEPDRPILAFDDHTGGYVDLDLSGDDEDVLARQAPDAPPPAPTPRAGKVGRPKLGVKAREVTLLPRHWDWLASQRGGASATLRRLVEDAIRNPSPQERIRQSQAAADRFMAAMLGDQPGYEEASRALYAGDAASFGGLIAHWPSDLRDYAARLAAPGFAAAEAAAPATRAGEPASGGGDGWS